ncbi:MAG: phosphoribosylformylglycinamidine synthase [Ruminococcaceae bacterium]|nr:phosphoribosylformylglycinamidine synthase [Oscillospiraceae bacterium]
MVRTVYSEKKPAFAVEAAGVLSDIKRTLNIKLENVRLINRYFVEGVDDADFAKAKTTIFSEPTVDDVYDVMPEIGENSRVLFVEYLPGQFDQRADSCAQCISLLTEKERPTVRSAKIYIITGTVSDSEFVAIKNYLINPVEAREASAETPETLANNFDIPETVKTLEGFIALDKEALASFVKEYGLAMDLDDICFLQDYFKNEEKRDPTITEIRMIDTYWSDHCRHTTFATVIENTDIEPEYVKAAYDKYLSFREELGIKKPQCLMDIATIGGKLLRKRGLLPDLDISEEINACSVNIKAKIDDEEKDYLLMFKNETHNHPTEIEPFGGAATCLGGAIRDPLSGRAYVYQSMRCTGAADPRVPFEDTLKGKLSQRKITTTAAAGFSSYGNQIGLATGLVNEFYHEGYVAKRMELGAVVGAAPKENVIREVPAPGDIIILLGGSTGRDGCGGATGSSKQHTTESITTCGAEVQKGNPPEERKIQRLFRNKDVTTLIKRCNDFGAGGVSVAIGELADGLLIDLNKVPKKYEGLDGTELAISESQERMAVVIAAEDEEKFIKYANAENLNAVKVADVTDTNRLTMVWNGNKIVDISRDFLNSNGASKYTDIKVSNKTDNADKKFDPDFAKAMKDLLSDLNVCAQKGLTERFDSTIGASSVFLPFGGKRQLTPSQVMAAKIPVDNGVSKTASVMAYGFNPYISSADPFVGAIKAIVESVSKLVASGCDRNKTWLSLQEFFARTTKDPARWGAPFEALLGALVAQEALGIAAIGGKDSMSGTFEKIDVPPTLVSFAISAMDAEKVLSNEFKSAGNKVYLLETACDENGIPKFDELLANYDKLNSLINEGKIKSCNAVIYGGIAEAVFKMAVGNGFGFEYSDIDYDKLFVPMYGSFVFESSEPVEGCALVGEITNGSDFVYGDVKVYKEELKDIWLNVLERIFPLNADAGTKEAKTYSCETRSNVAPAIKVSKPKILIPVFPGTNCEYDTAKAFNMAGGESEIFIIKNRSSADISETVKALSAAVKECQILMLPGGFSGGDEPDGSGKFIATFFNNPELKEAVNQRLSREDFLVLGICNGFQALIKLGIVPYGEIRDIDDSCPTLTYNRIGRHQSLMVDTRISSVKSPWMKYCNVGDIHAIPVSHGEGRFIASPEMMAQLAANGQIATQYVDAAGVPTMEMPFNPNASVDAVEGIFSPDGRAFGKMGHSERKGENVAKNIYGNKNQKIFEAGVDYFKM